jgi:hypothetical protein
MGILNVFSGKDPQTYEQKGDLLFRDGKFGDAKIQYETGLLKLEKKEPMNSNLKRRLKEKISKSKEALALSHMQRGKEILESEYYEEAEDIFHLALELTEDNELKKELQGLLKTARRFSSVDQDIDNNDFPPESDTQLDEYFLALCGAFSDSDREKEYHGYGKAFKEGYLALNQGDFELASTKLAEAMEENSSKKTYIPFELATAYLNLGRNEEAENLLGSFLEEHPHSLEGYQMLCETYWAQKEYDRALDLLAGYPGELNDHPELILFKGETLAQKDKLNDAENLFLDYLRSSGWDENIALALARIYEALDEKEKALDWYGNVMETCSGCGAKIPPLVKRKYSDISVECGRSSMDILEIYLSLVQEDPENRHYYYSRVSEIYSKMGYEEEAERFRSFADGSM